MKGVNRASRWALSSGITLLGLAVLWQFADPALLSRLLEESRPVWLLLGLGIFLLSLWLRSLRLSHMYGVRDQDAWSLHSVTLAAVMNFLLPARLGELSLVALVVQRLQQDYRSVVLSVAVIRIQEFLFASVLAIGWLLLAQRSVPERWWQGAGEGVSLWFAALLGLGLVIALWIARRFWQHALLAMPRAHARDPRLWQLSAAVALCMLLLIFCVARGLNIAQAAALTPLVFFAVLLVSFSPVNGLANVGGYHLAWALPLIGLGYDSDQAVSLAVLSHLVVFLMVLVALLLASMLPPDSRGVAAESEK